MSRGQVRPLLGLRWRMVRARGARVGFAALAAAVPLGCAAAMAGALYAPRDRFEDVLFLAPTALLSVALLAVLAPLVAGGGNELFPPDQLVAFPVTPATQHATSLLLSPLNLAWSAQLIGLSGLTAYLSGPGWQLTLSMATLLAYVAFVTAGGQAMAWLVVGVRARRAGRIATWALVAALGLAVALILLTARTGEVLDAAPTTFVVVALVNASSGVTLDWVVVTAVLVTAAVIALRAGRRTCHWALRQPTGHASGDPTSQVRRRRGARSPFAEIRAVDRASVWRSPSLRRGLVVLGLLPGLVAAGAGLDWANLVLLPGLVAAGAGLLFGVNAFCLDGSGALWLESLPRRPAAAFWSKTLVVAEVCVVATAITVVAGALRTPRPPTSAELAALVACAAVTSLRVVATCLHLSVHRPHRADLRGPRDTPAPPGVMALYSARLAVSTTLLALLFTGLAEAGRWQYAVLLAVLFMALSLRRLVGLAREWDEVSVRTRVAATVAAG